MNNFSHIAAGLRLFCGSDSLKSLPAELARVKSSRAVVFCGKTVAASPELLGAVRNILGERCSAVFAGVRAHSPVDTVKAGADLLRESRADAVIAIGGGSAIVTARAATILACEKDELRELCSHRDSEGRFLSPKLRAPKLPQFVVPTSPTTAMVKAGSGVFDSQSGSRLTMFDPKTRAQAVFLHPVFALSAPKQLAVAASLNALAMSVEGIESETSNPLSDGMLMHSLRLLARNLFPLIEAGESADVRMELMMAAILCGQGTDHASPGIASALGHALGLRLRIDNGLANGILLPHTMRFNAPVTGARREKVAEALGRPSDNNDAEAAIRAVKELVASLQVPKRLRDAGVPHEALLGVAETAMDDWFLHQNPRPINGVESVMTILDAAW